MAGGRERSMAGWDFQENKNFKYLETPCLTFFLFTSRWGYFHPTMWRRITLIIADFHLNEMCKPNLNVKGSLWATCIKAKCMSSVMVIVCACVWGAVGGIGFYNWLSSDVNKTFVQLAWPVLLIYYKFWANLNLNSFKWIRNNSFAMLLEY